MISPKMKLLAYLSYVWGLCLVHFYVDKRINKRVVIDVIPELLGIGSVFVAAGGILYFAVRIANKEHAKAKIYWYLFIGTTIIAFFEIGGAASHY